MFWGYIFMPSSIYSKSSERYLTISGFDLSKNIDARLSQVNLGDLSQVGAAKSI